MQPTPFDTPEDEIEYLWNLLEPNPETGIIENKLEILQKANNFDAIHGSNFGFDVVERLMKHADVEFLEDEETAPECEAWREMRDDAPYNIELYRALGEKLGLSVVLLELLTPEDDEEEYWAADKGQRMFARSFFGLRSDDPLQEFNDVMVCLTQEEFLEECPDRRVETMLNNEVTQDVPTVSFRTFTRSKGLWNFARARSVLNGTHSRFGA